jgi:hypothetical protein
MKVDAEPEGGQWLPSRPDAAARPPPDAAPVMTGPTPATGKGVLTRGYNLQRTGANLEEKVPHARPT